VIATRNGRTWFKNNHVRPELGERYFRRTVAEYVEHYHRERNHQGLANELIDPVASQCAGRVCRRPRLGLPES
jgi:hypothetical protein